MEYVVLLDLTLLCYAWLGARQRIVRSLRLRRSQVTNRHRRI